MSIKHLPLQWIAIIPPMPNSAYSTGVYRYRATNLEGCTYEKVQSTFPLSTKSLIKPVATYIFTLN